MYWKRLHNYLIDYCINYCEWQTAALKDVDLEFLGILCALYLEKQEQKNAALELYEAMEKKGIKNSILFYRLGMFYNFGWGSLTPDPITAMDYFEKAVALHHFLPACYQLGTAILKIKSGIKNLVRATDLLKMTVIEGFPPALLNAAFETKDIILAGSYLTQAADTGYAPADYYYALYLLETSCKKSRNEIMIYLKKAASLEYLAAEIAMDNIKQNTFSSSMSFTGAVAAFREACMNPSSSDSSVVKDKGNASDSTHKEPLIKRGKAPYTAFMKPEPLVFSKKKREKEKTDPLQQRKKKLTKKK